MNEDQPSAAEEPSFKIPEGAGIPADRQEAYETEFDRLEKMGLDPGEMRRRLLRLFPEFETADEKEARENADIARNTSHPSKSTTTRASRNWRVTDVAPQEVDDENRRITGQPPN